jgi:hypothetical protein
MSQKSETRAPTQGPGSRHHNMNTDIVDPFAVGCSYCGAHPGEQCVNGVTNRPMARALAHSCRITVAEREAES